MHQRLIQILALLLALVGLIVACYGPDFSGSGKFLCTKHAACPDEYRCVRGVCVKEGQSPPSHDGSVADGN